MMYSPGLTPASAAGDMPSTDLMNTGALPLRENPNSPDSLLMVTRLHTATSS